MHFPITPYRFTCSIDILKIQLYKQILHFQHQINFRPKNLKNQKDVSFVVALICVITPNSKCMKLILSFSWTSNVFQNIIVTPNLGNE
jgi:hypothetical protein